MMLEQLHSCEKASFKRPPLGDFEGLKEKLQYKLLKQTEKIMAKLQDDIKTFKTILMNKKSRQVSFFPYWPVENVQFCVNFIVHFGWLSGILNFPRFKKKCELAGTFKAYF